MVFPHHPPRPGERVGQPWRPLRRGYGWLCLLALTRATAGEALPDLDARDIRTPAASPARTEARVRAQETLAERLPRVQVDWEPRLGAPQWIATAGGFLTGPDGEGGAVTKALRARQPNEDPHRAVKSFVDEHSGLFGHDSAALGRARVTRDFTDTHNGLRTTVWQQEHAGLEVFEAVFKSHVTRNHELVNVSSRFLPQWAEATQKAGEQPAPLLSVRRAILLAAQHLGQEQAAEDGLAPAAEPAGAEQRQEFRSGFTRGPVHARLVWLPLDGSTLQLCWSVALSVRARPEVYRLLLEAQTGQVLLRRCQTEDISNASYRVFTGDSPTPLSPGYAAPGNPSQPPAVSRALVTLSALVTNASPNGWINDGVNETRGNNVDASTDLDDDDALDLPRPQGSPSRVFDFPVSLLQEPSQYSKAAVVNLFYWCNWAHDKLYELGFHEAAGNFQASNFGKGGLGGDPIRAEAQDGGGTRNANFNYYDTADGGQCWIQMYQWPDPAPDRDGDLDTHIVLHEYVHGLSSRLVGGGVGLQGTQPKGMGEGWSDFFALSLLSKAAQPLQGNYPLGAYSIKDYKVSTNAAPFADNYYFGIRRYPYSTNLAVNPLTFRDMDPAQASLHAGIPISPRFPQWSSSQVHSVGEIWCSMLWEARANLVAKHGFATGNGLILQLVMDGMKLAPANPTFVQARDAILQADQVLTAGANKKELWAAFAKRGLGVEAIAPASNTTLGVVEDYSLPDALMVKPLTVVTVSGPFGGPFNWTNKSYTLSNASAAPLTWSATAASPLQVSSGGGSLAPSATTTLTISLNAAAAASLPLGEFDRRVVISNHTSQLTRQRPFTWKVTEPLVLEPANSYANAELLYGPQGGPFTAYFGLLRLTNRSNLPMPWQHPAVPEFSLTPSSGTLAGHGFVDLTLSGGLAAPFLPIANYTNVLVISNLTTGLVQTRKAEIWVKNDQYLTQNFGTGFDEDFDLAQTQLTFLPDGSPAGYAVCREPAAAFPVDPAGGTEVLHDNLGYADFTQITLSGGKKVSLFGFATNKVFINLNGSLTFTQGDEHYQPYHFDLLRVSPLLASYDLSFTDDLGGVISWKQLTNRLVVTWQNLYTDAFPPASTNNFQVEMFFDGVIRFTILTGTGQRATVGLSRGVYTNSSSDFINTDFSARPACDALLLPLVVTGPASATEGVPFPAGAGRVIVQPAPPTPLVVSLVSSDPTEITIPGSVTVPAGSTSAVFNITVVNDALLDGTKYAVITASAPFRDSGSLAIPVHDNETTALQLSLPAAVTEGGPSVLGTVSTGSPVDDDVVVPLSSPTRPAQATLPFVAFAVIPAGQTSATFSVLAVDDTRIDGTQPATFVATVANWGSASDTLDVLDNEGTNLSVLGPLFISEGVGADLSNAAQVRLSGTLPTNLTVHLSGLGGAPFEYLVSGPVTIPAGQTNAAVALSIADDSVIESIETFQVTASAPGFASGSWSMLVFDNDGPPPPLEPQPPHLAGDVSLETGLSWAKCEGELLVNGGFEDGTLAGWTRVDSGGGGWVSASSSYNPPGTDTAQPPLAGLRSALSMQYGNGRHELHQDVAIPEGLSSVTLSWSQRLRNHGPKWDTNQQFRVELRDTANNVLTNLHMTQPGQPLLSDWTHHTFNLFPWRGETLRLTFVQIDELGTLNVSLDNVSIHATPSAPTTWQVYFGTDPSPDTTELQGTTTNTSWPLVPLATNTTYYWQVRSVRAGGTNTGPVWQFTTTETTNAPPVLSLRTPAHFSLFTHPAAISFALNSIRDDGSISKVEFWANGLQLGQDFFPPYGLTWSNAALGEHRVWAVAQDSLGTRGTSAVQRISVVPADGALKTLVPFGSDWSYHDVGGNLGTSWRSNSYRLTSAWKTGPGQLGYGDGDEATVLDFGDDPLNKPITTYLRQSFTAPAGLQLLQLRVLRDDGVAVYLNGNEVLRNNLAAGATYLTLASADVTAAQEPLLLVTNVSVANVVTRGGNLLAAEVHQSAASSVDLSFDLELAGVLNVPPLVSLATPASASVFVAPAQVPLGASASDPYGIVTNVQFLADGAVVGSDNTPPFSFVWSNAPVGPHTLRASATDNSGATNTSAAVTILVVGPQAALQVAIGPNGTLLTWPSASAGYRVEATASLDAPAAWESVPGTPVVQGSFLQLIVPPGPEPRRFFRLVAP